MIQTILILFVALAVALLIIYAQLAVIHKLEREIQAQARHIEAQRSALALHQQRIDSQIGIIAETEARNALLEWAIEHYITSLPKSGRTAAWMAKREISWN